MAPCWPSYVFTYFQPRVFVMCQKFKYLVKSVLFMITSSIHLCYCLLLHTLPMSHQNRHYTMLEVWQWTCQQIPGHLDIDNAICSVLLGWCVRHISSTGRKNTSALSTTKVYKDFNRRKLLKRKRTNADKYPRIVLRSA